MPSVCLDETAFHCSFSSLDSHACTSVSVCFLNGCVCCTSLNEWLNVNLNTFIPVSFCLSLCTDNYSEPTMQTHCGTVEVKLTLAQFKNLHCLHRQHFNYVAF